MYYAFIRHKRGLCGMIMSFLSRDDHSWDIQEVLNWIIVVWSNLGDAVIITCDFLFGMIDSHGEKHSMGSSEMVQSSSTLRNTEKRRLLMVSLCYPYGLLYSDPPATFMLMQNAHDADYHVSEILALLDETSLMLGEFLWLLRCHILVNVDYCGAWSVPISPTDNPCKTGGAGHATRSGWCSPFCPEIGNGPFRACHRVNQGMVSATVPYWIWHDLNTACVSHPTMARLHANVRHPASISIFSMEQLGTADEE